MRHDDYFTYRSCYFYRCEYGDLRVVLSVGQDARALGGEKMNAKYPLSPLQELGSIAKYLPLEVLQDVDKRIHDWLMGGGEEDDPYIEQQLRFARKFVTK